MTTVELWTGVTDIYQNLYFEAKGHADYNPGGEDIVCASVSLLCCMLAEEMKRTDGVIHEIGLTPGDVVIDWTNNGKTPERLEHIIEIFENGFTDLERLYPDNVRYYRNGFSPDVEYV